MDSHISLIVQSSSMGKIALQPVATDPKLLSETSLAIFPCPIERKDLGSIVEWAAATQIPIFCRGVDIPQLEREGFGSYRFLKLDGYREVDFQGGTLEFFPARPRRQAGLRTQLRTVAEFFGWSSGPTSFHVRIRPKNERPVLVLAGAEIDNVEWALLNRENPSAVVALDGAVSFEERSALELRFGAKILSSGAVAAIETAALPPSQAPLSRKPLGQWVANSR